ncbi:MAG: hypothetical protein RIF32_05260 [Leptospirales bacterium]|jgi:hypothetical protein
MSKRMWKQSFTFYVFLLAVPNIVLGLWLSIYPQTILPAFLPGHSAETIAESDAAAAAKPGAVDQGATADESLVALSPELKYIARMAGLGLFMVSMLLFTARRNPGQNRELMFWMSLYYAGLAVLNIAAAYFGEISLWTLPAGAFWLTAAFFLMAFASRYLLVRE